MVDVLLDGFSTTGFLGFPCHIPSMMAYRFQHREIIGEKLVRFGAGRPKNTHEHRAAVDLAGDMSS